MTLDVLEAISQHLSPAARLRFAEVDEETFLAAHKWRDMSVLHMDDVGVTISSDEFNHNVECSPSTRAKKVSLLLSMCPQVKRVYVQTRLWVEDLAALREKAKLLKKLYISCENFDRKQLKYGFRFEKLQTLHISMTTHFQLQLHVILETSSIVAFFPDTLRRVCLTGVTLSGELLDRIVALKSLRSLDLIGCLVDTDVGSRYIDQFSKLEDLDELSIPPSMFSLSSRSSNDVPYTFNKLNVYKLSLFMERFDEEKFQEQLKSIFPKKLETLVLFGNYYHLKIWKKLANITKIKIVFGPNEAKVGPTTGRIDNFGLVSHLVRRPPYVRDVSAVHPPVIGQTPTWRFSLAEHVALSRRINADEVWDLPPGQGRTPIQRRFRPPPWARGRRGPFNVDRRPAPQRTVSVPRRSNSLPTNLPGANATMALPAVPRSSTTVTSTSTEQLMAQTPTSTDSMRTHPPTPHPMADPNTSQATSMTTIQPLATNPPPVPPRNPNEPTEEGFQIITEFFATVVDILAEEEEHGGGFAQNERCGRAASSNPSTAIAESAGQPDAVWIPLGDDDDFKYDQPNFDVPPAGRVDAQ